MNTGYKKLALKGVLISLLFASLAKADEQKPIVIKVPVKSEYGQRHEFPLSILKFILDKSGVEYSIKFSDKGITTQARDIVRIKSNQDINLGWYGTSDKLERDLVPIRFPIWRGLLGYRIFIIHRDNQEMFDKVRSLEDLQEFQGDQGIGWSDIKILEDSGLRQDETKYDLIFRKIARKRSEYFSRSIHEAFSEVEVRKADYPRLAVEKNILLVYPAASFFFTNKENEELAMALEEGFKRSYEDGSFERFFYNHPVVKNVFKLADLEQRVRIEIQNPFMTEETLSIPEKYWHKKPGLTNHHIKCPSPRERRGGIHECGRCSPKVLELRRQSCRGYAPIPKR